MSSEVNFQKNNGLNQEKLSPEKVNIFLAFLIVTGMVIRFSLFHLHQIIEGDGVHYAFLARLISHEGKLFGIANEYWSNLWPAVIAFFDRFLFHDIELSGRMASTLFGSLTVIPVYLVARELFDKRTSLVAASLVIGQPFLIRFSVLLFTEAFYTFIFAFALWLGIRLVKIPDNMSRWSLFGIIIGLGLLTRPEIQVLAVLFPLAAFVCRLKKRILLKRVLIGALMFSVILLSFLSLRAALIWKVGGKWEFGFREKAAINLKMGDRIYDRIQHMKFINKFENGKFTNLQAAPENPLFYLLKNRQELARRVRTNAIFIGHGYYTVLSSAKGHLVLGIISFIFTGMGIIRSIFQERSRWLSVLLLAIVFVYSAPWLIMFVLDRFVVPLTVIAILFTARGLFTLERGLFSLFKNRKFSPVWPVISLIFVFVFTFRNTKWARHTWEGDPVVQKEAGYYLRANFPQDTKILTAGPHTPYYFYEGDPFARSVQNIPWAYCEEIVAYALEKKIELLVLPEWTLEEGDYPIMNLASENARCEDLKFITVIGNKKPFRIWIYRVLKKM